MSDTPQEGALARVPRQPYDIVPQQGIDSAMVTTAFGLSGYKVVRTYGIVRGIVVRSRSLFGNIGAAFQVLLGGNISLYTRLCEQTRLEAFQVMLQHAA